MIKFPIIRHDGPRFLINGVQILTKSEPALKRACNGLYQNIRDFARSKIESPTVKLCSQLKRVAEPKKREDIQDALDHELKLLKDKQSIWTAAEFTLFLVGHALIYGIGLRSIHESDTIRDLGVCIPKQYFDDFPEYSVAYDCDREELRFNGNLQQARTTTAVQATANLLINSARKPAEWEANFPRGFDAMTYQTHLMCGEFEEIAPHYLSGLFGKYEDDLGSDIPALAANILAAVGHSAILGVSMRMFQGVKKRINDQRGMSST